MGKPGTPRWGSISGAATWLRRNATRSSKWLVLTILSLISGFFIGGTLVAMGNYIPVIQKVEGWSSAELGAAVSSMLISVALSGMLASVLVDRMGARLTIVAGALIAVSGCWLATHVTSGSGFIAALAVLGIGMGASGPVPCIPAINHRFSHDRGLALGIYFAIISLGASLLPLAAAWFIQETGWRETLQATGILLGAISLAVFFVDLPSSNSNEARPASEGGRTAVNPGVAAAMRNPIFWLITLAMTLSLMSIQGVLYGTTSYFIQQGTRSVMASTIFSAANLVSLPALFLVGILTDRVGAGRMMFWGLLALAAGTIALLAASSDSAVGWLAVGCFVLLWGGASGVPSQVGSMLLADVTDARSFGRLLGVNTAVIGLVSALAPLLTSVIRQWSGGDYAPVFALYTVMAMAALLLIELGKTPCIAGRTYK